jgi:hypothetical protein
MPTERFSSSLAPRYRAHFVSAANWNPARAKEQAENGDKIDAAIRVKTTTLSIAYTLAEVVGFELRNVVVNYPFERSHRFAEIQRNSGHRDYSRLSCSVRHTQLGPNARISTRAFSRGRWSSSCASRRWQELPGSRMIRLRPIKQHHCSLGAGL